VTWEGGRSRRSASGRLDCFDGLESPRALASDWCWCHCNVLESPRALSVAAEPPRRSAAGSAGRPLPGLVAPIASLCSAAGLASSGFPEIAAPFRPAQPGLLRRGTVGWFDSPRVPECQSVGMRRGLVSQRISADRPPTRWDRKGHVARSVPGDASTAASEHGDRARSAANRGPSSARPTGGRPRLKRRAKRAMRATWGFQALWCGDRAIDHDDATTNILSPMY